MISKSIIFYSIFVISIICVSIECKSTVNEPMENTGNESLKELLNSESNYKEMTNNDEVYDKSDEEDSDDELKRLKLLLLKKALIENLLKQYYNSQDNDEYYERPKYPKYEKRNPEFSNSLLLYNKLFKQLKEIGKRK